MPFPIPSLEDVVTRQLADIETSIDQTTPLLDRSLLRVLAAVTGGGHHEQYQFLQWIARQGFPDSADEENLRRWAAIWGVLPKERTFASGTIQANGADGVPILAGTALLGLNKIEYEVQQSATINGGTANLEVVARTAGAAGDLAAAQSLTFLSAIPGVNAKAIALSPGISGGFDDETADELLDRLLQRIQSPPQGGATTDYELWASEVPGVTRVWVFPGHMGPGTVGVTFVSDNAANIIPSANLVAEVQEYLDDPGRKPITAQPVVFAPISRSLDLSLRIVPDTPELRSAITNELKKFLPSYGIPDSVVALSEIQAIISSLPNELSNEIVSPTEGFAVAATEIVELGVITWL